MTVKDEVVSMMDYLGMDQFPQDGYSDYADIAQYDGEFIDGYDGYQITITFDKIEDTLTTQCTNLGAGATPRTPYNLFILRPVDPEDPDPMDVDLEGAEGIAILAAIHECLMWACRNKVRKELINQELDLLSLPCCKY
jgi:hypothetical protein